MTRRAWAATFVAAVALVAAVVRVPAVLRSAHDAVTAPRGPALERDLEPDWWPQPYIYRLAVGVRKIIPRGATYAVVMHITPSTADLVRDGLPSLLQYALLPRRYTTNLDQADYVITWDRPSDSLGVAVRHEYSVTEDGNVVEVRR